MMTCCMLELWWCVGRRHVARVTEGPRYHHLLLQYIIHHTSQQYIYIVGGTWLDQTHHHYAVLVITLLGACMCTVRTVPGYHTVHLMGVQNGADLKYIHYTYTHSYVHTVLYILYMCICMYSSREFGQNTIQQCCSYRSTVSRSLESTPSTAARIRSDDVVQLFPRALKRFIVGDRVALV